MHKLLLGVPNKVATECKFYCYVSKRIDGLKWSSFQRKGQHEYIVAEWQSKVVSVTWKHKKN